MSISELYAPIKLLMGWVLSQTILIAFHEGVGMRTMSYLFFDIIKSNDKTRSQQVKHVFLKVRSVYAYIRGLSGMHNLSFVITQ